MTRPRPLPSGARQRGAGIIETMVGILIGLLVVLVIYNLLAVSESYRRTTTGISDAQITGLLAQLIAGRDLANGGNGISLSQPDLINCIKDETGTAFVGPTASAKPFDDPVLTLRPIPILIKDGGQPYLSDSFISTQSGSPHVIWPVPFVGTVDAIAGADFVVQSPTGFSKPDQSSLPTGTLPFWAIVMANNNSGICKLVKITNAVAGPDATLGQTTLTQDPSTATTITYKAAVQGSGNTGALLVNLGPRDKATRIQYDVAGDQLRTTDLLNGGVANPIAQNVVLMKVQYGIDKDGDQIVDCWTAADNNDTTCKDGKNYSSDPVAGVPSFDKIVDVNRILAVRIGLVVRSDEPALQDATLVNSSGHPRSTYLFNCVANDDATCQGRILVSAGTGPTDIIKDYWRYRTYETVIPLRNAIFNSTL